MARVRRGGEGPPAVDGQGLPQHVHRYLIEEFGNDTLLHTIDTERIDAFRERMLAEGRLSRRTVQKILVLLHGILKRAKRKGWVATNAAEDAERVTVRRSGDFNVL